MEENRRETYEVFYRNVWPNLKKKMPKLALKKPQATKEQAAKAGHTLTTASNVTMEDKGQEEPGRTVRDRGDKRPLLRKQNRSLREKVLYPRAGGLHLPTHRWLPGLL